MIEITFAFLKRSIDYEDIFYDKLVIFKILNFYNCKKLTLVYLNISIKIYYNNNLYMSHIFI